MSYTDTTPGGDDRGRSDAAKEHAADLRDHAVGAGQDLGQSARVEARGVARDVRHEARGLFDSVSAEAGSQVRTGQRRLAETVRSLAEEVGEMADGSQRDGQASQLARTLAGSGEDVARWLEDHEPADALDSVRRYASRNPLTFLAIAAGAGLLVGRFARGFQAEAADDRRSQAYEGPAYEGQRARGRAYAQDERGAYDAAPYGQTGHGQSHYGQSGYDQTRYAAQPGDAGYAQAHGFGDQGAHPGSQAEAGAQGQSWQQQSGTAYDQDFGAEGRR